MIKFLNIKNESFKSAVKTVLFYAIYYLVSTIAEQFQKTGPCNPGLGMILLFFLPFITFILLIINLIKYKFYLKKYLKFSIIIHFVALLFFLSFYIYITNV
jgi:glucan phosphoethanolaminetransferase (alkaline phosphatase superfamily)